MSKVTILVDFGKYLSESTVLSGVDKIKVLELIEDFINIEKEEKE